MESFKLCLQEGEEHNTIFTFPIYRSNRAENALTAGALYANECIKAPPPRAPVSAAAGGGGIKGQQRVGAITSWR